jgi:hypothetical protein
MGDEHNAHGVFQPGQCIHEFRLRVPIKGRRRLIENEKPWFTQQCTRNADALPLASR